MTPTRVCVRVDNEFTHDLRVSRTAGSLAAASYEVTVLADARPYLADDEMVDGVRILRVGRSSKIPYWSLVRPLRDLDADIYHANDIDSLFPCLAAARLSHGPRAKVVYDTHELWSGHAKDKIHRKRAVLIKFEGPMTRAADALVAASPAYTETLTEKYHLTKPAVTILNTPFWREEDQLTPHWRIRDERPGVRIGYVSVFQKGRGARQLIESLAHLPEEYTLELIGPTPQPEYERELHAAAEPFGERVIFAGRIPADEIVGRLAECDLSAVTIEPLSLSYRLTSPNKLYDSLMAGTPIIGSDMVVIGRVIKETGAGLICDVDNPADIARAVLEAHDTMGVMRTRARAAAKRYSWEHEERALLDLYAELQPA